MKQVSTLSIVLQTYDTALGRWEGVIFRHYLNNLHKPQNSWLLQFTCHQVKLQKQISLLDEMFFFPVQFLKLFYFMLLKGFNMAILALYEYCSTSLFFTSQERIFIKYNTALLRKPLGDS